MSLSFLGFDLQVAFICIVANLQVVIDKPETRRLLRLRAACVLEHLKFMVFQVILGAVTSTSAMRVLIYLIVCSDNP